MNAGYQNLVFPNNLSRDAQRLIRDQLDMQLADVHAMMRLPINSDLGLKAGCNLAAAQVLLSLISGVSATLFHQGEGGARGRSKELFIRVLETHYPWDQEIDTPDRHSREDAAKHLYSLFRNPLAHALGVVDTETNKDGRSLLVVKAPMQAAELYELEMTGQRSDRWLDPTIESNAQTVILRIKSLYWGVREMIERVSRTDYPRSFSFVNSSEKQEPKEPE